MLANRGIREKKVSMAVERVIPLGGRTSEFKDLVVSNTVYDLLDHCTVDTVVHSLGDNFATMLDPEQWTDSGEHMLYRTKRFGSLAALESAAKRFRSMPSRRFARVDDFTYWPRQHLDHTRLNQALTTFFSEPIDVYMLTLTKSQPGSKRFFTKRRKAKEVYPTARYYNVKDQDVASSDLAELIHEDYEHHGKDREADAYTTAWWWFTIWSVVGLVLLLLWVWGIASFALVYGNNKAKNKGASIGFFATGLVVPPFMIYNIKEWFDVGKPGKIE